jgi:hypothetical protein
MSSINKKILWLTLFSIAMGFMETAIVVYLRKIYYPGGFQFPLVPIDHDLAFVEFLREAATIIMLVGIGILTGKSASHKFAFFIYCFAIWDLCYYLFLKVFLNWPISLLTWDILFLIPVPWVAPVLIPCLLSINMIILAGIIIYNHERGIKASVSQREWLLFIIGCIVVIISFIQDYFVQLNGQYSKIWTLAGNKEMFGEIHNYIPGNYNWSLFILAEIFILSGTIHYIKRSETLALLK